MVKIKNESCKAAWRELPVNMLAATTSHRPGMREMKRKFSLGNWPTGWANDGGQSFNK